jgi:hypothetical protein
MLKVKIAIFDVAGMDEVVQACQSGAFAEQEKFDSGNYGVGDGEEEGSIVNSYRVDMLADIDDDVRGFEVSDVLEERDTGHRSSRTLVSVYRVTGRSRIQPENANHVAEALEWAVEEEVGLNRSLDMKMVMRKGRLAVEQRHSLVMDVCPVRLAVDGYILESPGEEDQLGLA